MGQAKRRKESGTMPHKTPKPENKTRLKRFDNYLGEFHVYYPGMFAHMAIMMGTSYKQKSS